MSMKPTDPKAGHTPGRWTAHFGWESDNRSEPDQKYPDWCEVTSEYDSEFRRMSVTGHIGIANARVIAASPDMLAALRTCLNYIQNTESEFGIKLDCGDAARAAIARAEGDRP